MGETYTPNLTPNAAPNSETCGRCPTRPQVYAVGGLMPAPPGWEATFRDDDLMERVGDNEAPNEGEDDDPPDDALVCFDVIAFDAQGHALIIDEKMGGLRAANSYDDFVAVRRREDTAFAAFLPATGWQMSYGREGAEPQVTPVIAWAIRQDGDVVPIHVDPCGAHQYVWAAQLQDPEYSQLKYIPPTLVAHPSAHGRVTGLNGGRPISPPSGRKAAIDVGGPLGGEGDAQVGGTAAAQSPPTSPPSGRKAAPPKKAPSGRKAAAPKGTPTVDDLTPTLRERLVQLGAQYPGVVPVRDTVILQMKERGVPGFTNKDQVGLLVKVLNAERTRFANLTADQEVTA